MMTAIEAPRKIIYVRNATWWEYLGTMADAKKLHNTCKHQYFDGTLGEKCTIAQQRPRNYLQLHEEARWEIDRELQILDWDGEPTT